MVTYVIIGLTVFMSFYTWQKGNLASLMMNPYSIKRSHQYYRLITSGFIHKDHMHLIFNMFSLYFFGATIEMIFNAIWGGAGSIYYVVLYVSAIVVSDLPTYIKQQNNPSYNSLGASGGVAAVVFAYILFAPLADLCIYGIFCLPGIVLGIAYVAYSYYQGIKSNDGINHDAHLYGSIYGWIFCAIFYPASVGLFFNQIKTWALTHF